MVRVSLLAGHLERKGLPKKMMSVGLVKGKPGYIDLYFYRYKPLNVPDEIKEMREKEEKAEIATGEETHTQSEQDLDEDEQNSLSVPGDL